MPPRAKLTPQHAPGESKDGDWRVDVSEGTSRAMGESPARRRREYFSSKGRAEGRCAEIRDAKASASTGAGALTMEQRAEAFRCFGVAQQHGFTLTAAVEAMREQSVQAQRSILVPGLVEEFLTYKQGRSLSHDYLKDSRVILNRFAATYPDTLASDLTAEMVTKHLDSLAVEQPKEKGVRRPTGIKSPVSWNNHRRVISVLLNFAARHNPPYVKANVCTQIEEKPVPSKEVEIFTVDEARRLLIAAGTQDRRIVPILSIALFAGIRPDESRRLEWAEIHWPESTEETGYIEVKASKSKDGKRRLVEIQPNLLAWLLPFRPDANGKIWPLGRHAYYETMPAVRKAAGVERIHDGFRHSFASHHLARFSDLGRTTNDLGHRTTAMLFEHYRSAVKRSEGVAYFNIFPTP